MGPRARALSALATAAVALAASACTDAYLDREGPRVQARLDVARSIGEKVDAAPLEAFRPTSTPMRVCSLQNTPPRCDAILVRSKTLRDPAAERGHDTHLIATHDGVLGNAANVLRDRTVISHDRGPTGADGKAVYVDRPIPQKLEGIKHWFEAYLAVRWYLVVRDREGTDTSGTSRYGADVFVFDAETGAAHGSFPLDAACEDSVKVSLKSGDVVGSTHCLNHVADQALERAVQAMGAAYVR